MHASLKNLEAAVLTARSGTSEEARLRTDEAALILEWVERAKSIEPSGQVVIAQAANRDGLLLENGDILRVSAEDGLVLVSGEVLFPATVAFDPGWGEERRKSTATSNTAPRTTRTSLPWGWRIW